VSVIEAGLSCGEITALLCQNQARNPSALILNGSQHRLSYWLPEKKSRRKIKWLIF
jgi:hypothetical protein